MKYNIKIMYFYYNPKWTTIIFCCFIHMIHNSCSLKKNQNLNTISSHQQSRQEIDQEIEGLVQWAYQRSVEILKANKDDFFFLSRKLKENRDLYVGDFEEMDIRF